MRNTVRFIGTVLVPFDIALEGKGKHLVVAQAAVLEELARQLRAGVKVLPGDLTIKQQTVATEDEAPEPEFNRWKLTDEDPAYVIEYFTDEIKAYGAYVKAVNSMTVRLYGCTEAGDDLSEWELLESND